MQNVVRINKLNYSKMFNLYLKKNTIQNFQFSDTFI